MVLVVIGLRCRRRRCRWDLPPVTNEQETVACSPRINLIRNSSTIQPVNSPSCGWGFRSGDKQHCALRRIEFILFINRHKLVQLKQHVLGNNNLVFSLQAWTYALSGFFRKFSLTSFFSLYENYLVEYTGLTLQRAATCSTVLGCSLIVGILMSTSTHRIKYNRLAIHSLSQVLGGIFVICLTALHTEVIYLLILILFPNYFADFEAAKGLSHWMGKP